MTTPALDVFDLLDVSRREDSYSSLLRHLLEHSPSLRARMLAHAFERNGPKLVDDTVEVYFRKRNKGKSPDLRISGKDADGQQWELFIENKIDANESSGQTQSYLDACREAGVNAAGIYLTLDGHSPQAENSVRELSHEVLGGWVKECLPELKAPTLRTVAKAYVSRACKPRPMALPDDTVGGLLDTRSSLFPKDATIKALGDAVVEAARPGWCRRTDKSRGKVVLKFHRSKWVGTEMAGNRFNRDSYDIHVELEPFKDKWSLALHFETRPYKRAKELKGIAGLEHFEAMRESFRDAVHKRIPDQSDWKKSTWKRHYLQICKFPLDVDLSSRVGDVVSTMAKALETVRPAVDAALREVRPTRSPPSRRRVHA